MATTTFIIIALLGIQKWITKKLHPIVIINKGLVIIVILPRTRFTNGFFKGDILHMSNGGVRLQKSFMATKSVFQTIEIIFAAQIVK